MGMQEYKNAGLIVRFDPGRCTHSGNCVRGLQEVFNVKARPWVNVDGAVRDRIVQQVKLCPSGALTCEIVDPEK